MQLIDEQDDLSFALLYFFQNSFQTFLKFTSIFSTGYQRTHIQGKQLLIFQAVRNITTDYSLRQTFYNGCFTNTRFTDQHRIIFGLS